MAFAPRHTIEAAYWSDLHKTLKGYCKNITPRQPYHPDYQILNSIPESFIEESEKVFAQHTYTLMDQYNKLIDYALLRDGGNDPLYGNVPSLKYPQSLIDEAENGRLIKAIATYQNVPTDLVMMIQWKRVAPWWLASVNGWHKLYLENPVEESGTYKVEITHRDLIEHNGYKSYWTDRYISIRDWQGDVNRLVTTSYIPYPSTAEGSMSSNTFGGGSLTVTGTTEFMGSRWVGRGYYAYWHFHITIEDMYLTAGTDELDYHVSYNVPDDDQGYEGFVRAFNYPKLTKV